MGLWGRLWGIGWGFNAEARRHFRFFPVIPAKAGIQSVRAKLRLAAQAPSP